MIIKQCKICDLCLNNSFIPTPPIGNLNSRIMIVVDSKNKKNIAAIESAMYIAGFNDTEYYLTYLVKCRSKKPLIDYYRIKCKQWLDIEKRLPFNIVMLFGSNTYNAYFNYNPKHFYSKAIDKIIMDNNKFILTAYSPTVTYYESKYNEFSKIFERVDTLYRDLYDANHHDNLYRLSKFQSRL